MLLQGRLRCDSMGTIRSIPSVRGGGSSRTPKHKPGSQSIITSNLKPEKPHGTPSPGGVRPPPETKPKPPRRDPMPVPGSGSTTGVTQKDIDDAIAAGQ